MLPDRSTERSEEKADTNSCDADQTLEGGTQEAFAAGLIDGFKKTMDEPIPEALNELVNKLDAEDDSSSEN